MEQVIAHRGARPGFWNEYAPWYEQWLCHNDYHKGILRWITALAKPGWKVLDIGAGSGVLSVPLSEKDCDVTALEPSCAMSELLRQKALRRQVKGLHIEKGAWEEIPPDRYQGFDLMIACNSLHLSSLGFSQALEKVFRCSPQRFFLVTEFHVSDIKEPAGAVLSTGIPFPPYVKIPLLRKDYVLRYACIKRIRSDFVYHNTQEAISHWTVIKGCPLKGQEKRAIALRLRKKGKHFWLLDEDYVGIYYWTRREKVSRTVFKISRKTIHTNEQSTHQEAVAV